MSETVRLSININRETLDALREISGKRHITVTETVRRGVAMLKYFEDAISRGDQVQLEDPQGYVTRLEML